MSQHLETVIKSKIPGIQSLINKTIAELEAELTRLGKPVAADAGVSFLFKIHCYFVSSLVKRLCPSKLLPLCTSCKYPFPRYAGRFLIYSFTVVT